MAEKKYKMTVVEYNALKSQIETQEQVLADMKRRFRRAKITDEYNLIKNPNGPKMSGIYGQLGALNMKLLFGASYNNMWFYNFDTKTWNTDKYLGHDIFNERYNTTNVYAMKQMVELDFPNLEVAGCAMMPVSLKDYPNLDKRMIDNPIPNYRGMGMVGTLICRNKDTNEFLAVKHNWVGVGGFTSREQMIQAAMSNFAVRTARDYYFRQRVMAKYKQK